MKAAGGDGARVEVGAMTASLTRYFVAALAFAFVVTAATHGLAVAVLATAAAGIVVAYPRLERLRRAPQQPRRRRPDAYELVPDDPSLIIGVQQ
jgi:hypothetical protein